MIARGCVTLIVSGPGSCLIHCFSLYNGIVVGLLQPLTAQRLEFSELSDSRGPSPFISYMSATVTLDFYIPFRSTLQCTWHSTDAYYMSR